MISTPFVAVPPRDYGGTELIVHELAEGLAARGHEVILFATGDSRTRGELRWLFERAQWPPDELADIDHVSWALAEARAADVDLVHAHSAVALGLVRLAPELPLVYTIHHARDERFSALYRNHPHANYVAISADQGRREIPLPRATVIHHGLDPSRYDWAPRAEPYLAFVSRLAPEKGPDLAIDVAARAGLELRVAGGVHPPDRDFATRELEHRLLQPHVRYLGVIGPEVKRPLLRGARALLAPLRWHEPFGLILIEAMLSGCPVVAFRMGSAPELVEEGVTGFLVNTIEEMTAIVRPGGALEGFDRGRCRRRAVERFASARMVSDHERLYQRVLAEHSPHPHRHGRRGAGRAVMRVV
ncbi:MAG TPA: glycosyltransferase family 4 protein [Gemmatimonadales bacterium]|nr:glycosyltransferase family 4 protein [Gemmatimonadales bacterium]